MLFTHLTMLCLFYWVCNALCTPKPRHKEGGKMWICWSRCSQRHRPPLPTYPSIALSSNPQLHFGVWLQQYAPEKVYLAFSAFANWMRSSPLEKEPYSPALTCRPGPRARQGPRLILGVSWGSWLARTWENEDDDADNAEVEVDVDNAEVEIEVYVDNTEVEVDNAEVESSSGKIPWTISVSFTEYRKIEQKTKCTKTKSSETQDRWRTMATPHLDVGSLLVMRANHV